MIPLSISLAALAVSIYAWRLAVKQKKKAAETIKTLRQSQDELLKEHSALRLLCNYKTACLYKYSIREDRIGFAVCKERDGRCCVIKYFDDEDMDFNRLEAEDLIEKLNEVMPDI